MTVEIAFLSFVFYSFVGWFYESTLCSLYSEKRFINRGFLLGPYCPVYGSGAILCYFCLEGMTNPIMLFVASMILCCIVEYLTGYGMEKIFHAKWWDYSRFPFQLHGRICLYGALLFGFASMIICLFLQPELTKVLSEVPSGLCKIVAVCIGIAMMADVFVTVVSWRRLNCHLENIYQNISDKTNGTFDEMSEYLLKKVPVRILNQENGLQVWIADKNTRLKKSELRFFHAFPNIKIFAHEKLLKRIEIRGQIKNVYEKLQR